MKNYNKYIYIFFIIIIFILIIILYKIKNKDKYISKPNNNITTSPNNILTCIGKKVIKGVNLQSSIAWCLMEFLTGTSSTWDSSIVGGIIKNLNNSIILKDIATITLGTCPDPKTQKARETCAFTGDQCACGWWPFAACQNPPQNACPRNPNQQCSCGGSAMINALLNDISNITHLKVDSIDNVSIPNLLDDKGELKLSVTVSIPDLFIEGGSAGATANGYFCPTPDIEVGADVKGLGCTVSATVQLDITAKITTDGSYITLSNSSLDFNIKSYKVYNGVGWVYLDILGIPIPFGIELGGILINILSATNIFTPWFKTIIDGMKGTILGPLNEQLGKIKIPIGASSSFNNFSNINYPQKSNILHFKNNDKEYYRYYHTSMINTNFNHTLGTHSETLQMYSTGTKCQLIKDSLLSGLINKLGGSSGIFSKLKSSYNLSNIKTAKLITPTSGTDILGLVNSITRTDGTFAYSIALGLINFNFNFVANLTQLNGLNLTTITIPKQGLCITQDKTISIELDNKINSLSIGCNIESGGNLYIPYTTEIITVTANPKVLFTFTLQMKLVGKLNNDNIITLDESQCTLTFSDVKTELTLDLNIKSSEAYFQPIFTDISKDLNNLIVSKLSPVISTLIQQKFGDILTPIIVKLIDDAQIKLPL